VQLFQREAPSWALNVGVRQRLLRFGIPRRELPELLTTFTRDIQDGDFLGLEEKSPAQLTRLLRDITSPQKRLAIDQALTSFLYTWATDPRHRKAVEGIVSGDTLDRMARLRTAVDFTRLADGFPLARSMRRKLILHVGPTNSGKTHTALRTLAASRVGAYGGPLRLLAHEIYERLNTGQIVPLGAEAADNYEVDDTSNLDVQVPGTPRAVLKHGNALFARPCSLITGDELRYVEDATLYSCTVEMLSLSKRYDVVVIDEIQMIADSQRGSAWTAAVLGTAAEELHLCGEERAIPIVQALAKITGDELIVNHYQRLSPLEIAPQSLERDLTRIQKGDCVVTFSRSNIFNLKKAIEEKTGLRCAVVYGRLPPEIRAEQAALFNSPNSGVDVLIASDAVGMGLNL
jgi:ATP-dependent RNA helicase SUPV3L1/SUV3